MIKSEDYQLANGLSIPKIGFGTWQITDKAVCEASVEQAILAGYRHIDTALAYGNEQFIGKVIQKFERKNLFITSKLPAETKGYAETKDAFKTTLANLGLDYLDLYLIHAPRPWGDTSNVDYMPLNIESWRAMEELYDQGLIKAIGVSNFSDQDLKRFLPSCRIKPQVNQICIHIGHSDAQTKKYCDEQGILVEAYCPLASGKIFNNQDVIAMADKYHVTVAQLAIKWCLMYGTLPLPKSVHEERIVANLSVDFVISDSDYQKLCNL